MKKCTYDQIKILGSPIPLTAEVFNWPTERTPWLFEWDSTSAYFLSVLKILISDAEFNNIMGIITQELIEQYWDEQETVVR